MKLDYTTSYPVTEKALNLFKGYKYLLKPSSYWLTPQRLIEIFKKFNRNPQSLTNDHFRTGFDQYDEDQVVKFFFFLHPSEIENIKHEITKPEKDFQYIPKFRYSLHYFEKYQAMNFDWFEEISCPIGTNKNPRISRNAQFHVNENKDKPKRYRLSRTAIKSLKKNEVISESYESNPILLKALLQNAIDQKFKSQIH